MGCDDTYWDDETEHPLSTDLKFFSNPDLSPLTVSRGKVHVYVDDTNVGAAVYVNGKVWVAGDTSKVCEELFRRLSITVTDIDGSDLWIDEYSSEWDPRYNEAEIDAAGREERQRRDQINELKAKLHKLEQKQMDMRTQPTGTPLRIDPYRGYGQGPSADDV